MVHGGSFLERSSSVGLCFCGLFGILSLRAASRRPLVAGRSGNRLWIERMMPHVCGKSLGRGVLSRRGVCGTDGDDGCCDLLFLECVKSRCYSVLHRARAVSYQGRLQGVGQFVCVTQKEFSA